MQQPAQARPRKGDGETRRPRIGIVGTAGRGADARRMTLELFEAMVSEARRVVADKGLRLEQTRLVSGGSAWADHVAVRLFLLGEAHSLELHLPCEWSGGRFVETEARLWHQNPGRALNTLHAEFSNRVGWRSLREIEEAIARGAVICTKHKGFHTRNTHVAERSELLVAFTWGEGDTPGSSGTLDTWNKCPEGARVHIPLSGLACGAGSAKRSATDEPDAQPAKRARPGAPCELAV